MCDDHREPDDPWGLGLPKIDLGLPRHFDLGIPDSFKADDGYQAARTCKHCGKEFVMFSGGDVIPEDSSLSICPSCYKKLVAEAKEGTGPIFETILSELEDLGA